MPQSLSDLSVSWNSAGTTFTALKFSITDTASASGSLLFDFRSGAAGTTSVLTLGKDGSLKNPTYAGDFSWRYGDFVVSSGSNKVFVATANGLHLGNTFLGFSQNPNFTDTPDTRLYRDGAADTLALKRSTNPQTFRLYRTDAGANSAYTSLTQDATAGFIANSVYLGSASVPTNLLDLQANGTSRFRVDPAGSVVLGNTAQVALTTAAAYSKIKTLGNASFVFTDSGDNDYFHLDVNGPVASLRSGWALAWSNSATSSGGTRDTFLLRDGAANTLAQRNGANVQTFRLYRTYNSGTDYAFTALKQDATAGFILDSVNATATASTNLLDVQDNGTSRVRVTKSGQVILGAGSSSFPVLCIGGDDRSGFYDLINGIGYVTNTATPVFTADFNSGLQILGGMYLGWSDSTNGFGTYDTRLYRDAANTLALRNGGTAGTPVPQTFRLYNWTDNGSNYERGFVRWNTNVLEIGTEKGGTGGNRALRLVHANGGYLDCTPTDSNNWNFSTGLRIGLNNGTVVLNALAEQAFNGVEVTRTSIMFGREVNGNFSIGGEARSNNSYSTGTFTVYARSAWASATTNIVGGALVLTAGSGASGSSGAANGGDITLTPGTGYGTGRNGVVILQNLPTSATGLPTGAIWNDAGTLKVA